MKYIPELGCFILFIMMVVSGFMLLTTDANSTSVTEQAPIASFESGKVNMYRVIDEETGMVCYPLVGHLHGKTVANFCLPLNPLIFN